MLTYLSGRHDAIFRVVEELRQCEADTPAGNDDIVFLHLSVQKLGHPSIRPPFLSEKLRMDAEASNIQQ